MIGRGGFGDDGAAMVGVGDVGGERAGGEGGDDKQEKKKGVDPLLMVTEGDRRANCDPRFRDRRRWWRRGKS